MRLLRLPGYFFLRGRRALIAVAIGLLIVAMLVSVGLREEPVLEITRGADGIQTELVNDNLNLDFSYSFPMSVLMLVFALAIFRKERKLLVSHGICRYEFLLGSVIFGFALALLLTLLTFVISVLNRVFVMLVISYRPAGGWSAAMILWNNRSALDTLLMYASRFFEYLTTFSTFALLSLVWQRWWKALLTLLGIGIAVVVALVLQVRYASYGQQLLDILNWLTDFAVNTLLPWLDFLNNRNTFMNVFLEPLLIALAQFALCFAALFKMPLKGK